MHMSNTTTAQRYFVITAQSQASAWGRTLFLGFGKSEEEAWDNATGEGRKNRNWFCRECDAEFYASEGLSGEVIF